MRLALVKRSQFRKYYIIFIEDLRVYLEVVTLLIPEQHETASGGGRGGGYETGGGDMSHKIGQTILVCLNVLGKVALKVS